MRYSTTTLGNYVLSDDGTEEYLQFAGDSPVFNADDSFDPAALLDLANFLQRIAWAVRSGDDAELAALCNNGKEV